MLTALAAGACVATGAWAWRMVEGIIADGVGTTAETKDVTILFADLQGFTALAETLEPTALVALLNAHFERMAEAIAAHRGHLAKFIGDGLLGTSGVREYGVLGHSVNLASRVEGLTRVHAADILATDAVRAACDTRFRLRALPAVEVKGLPEPLVTFAVDGFGAPSGGG